MLLMLSDFNSIKIEQYRLQKGGHNLHQGSVYVIDLKSENNGPKTEPWGTPKFTERGVVFRPLTRVNWPLSLKYGLKYRWYNL